jgi:hypothetical protein
MGTGMDVTCSVADPADPLEMPLETAEASVSGVAAAAGSEAESLGAQALALALLVSPFFFWGTSMVGMKVRASRSTASSMERASMKQIARRLLNPRQCPSAVQATNSQREHQKDRQSCLVLLLCCTYGIMHGSGDLALLRKL